MPLGLEFHVKPVFVFKIFLVLTGYRALLDLRIYGPDSWRSKLSAKFRIERILAQTEAPGDLVVK